MEIELTYERLQSAALNAEMLAQNGLLFCLSACTLVIAEEGVDPAVGRKKEY
jgi:hypothetical protein